MKDFSNIISRFIDGKIRGCCIASGSERKFYRIYYDDASCVILFDEDTESISRYAILLENLYHHGVPVPRVYAIDETTGAMVMEDIGKTSLFDWYRISGDIEPHFRAARALAKIHSLDNIHGGIEMEFSITDFIYETQYFLRHFLIGYCGFPESIGDALSDEFRLLAHRSSQAPKSLMHRDYQSQNIFIVPGDVKIVDFQGARIGFSAYDIASLIEDPYLNFPESSGAAILNCYLQHSVLPPAEVHAFLMAYPYNALQRLLQAMAAYAYLSSIRRKRWFERFIIPARKRVHTLLEKLPEFPMLAAVIDEVEEMMKNRS